MSGLPPVHEWAESATRVPSELILAGDVLLVGPDTERTVAASVPDAGTREQIITFTEPHGGHRAGAVFRCRWGTYAYRLTEPG